MRQERYCSAYVKSVYYASFGGPPWGVYSFASFVGRPRGQRRKTRVPRVRDGCFAFRFPSPPFRFVLFLIDFIAFAPVSTLPGRDVYRTERICRYFPNIIIFSTSRGARDRAVNAAARATVRGSRIHIYSVLLYYGVPRLNGAHGTPCSASGPFGSSE